MKSVFLYFSLTILFIYGCTDTSKNNENQTTQFKTERPQATINVDNEAHYNPVIEKQVRILDSIYDQTPYYCELNGRILFYVVNGKWFPPDENGFRNSDIHMGIVDAALDTLLILNYDKIYNPDATAKGYIEIESNNKRGLFDYVTNKIIKPEYDIIFPSPNAYCIALGKKGEEYFAIRKDTILAYSGNIPAYYKLSDQWNFDIKSATFVFLHETKNYYHDDTPINGDGLIFTPSYLLALGHLPEHIGGINFKKNAMFARTDLKGKIVESNFVIDKLFALISDFYEEGIDTRAWNINKQKLITVDSLNNVLDKIEILNKSDNLEYCEGENSGYRFVRPDLLEVYDIQNTYEVYKPYSFMTMFQYYKINTNGKIEKLESPRHFDCTKFATIKEAHFKGCFSVHYGEEIKAGDEHGNVCRYSHLSIEDLEVMRNEIYAEYGLKFKLSKWNTYFRKQSWYSPKYDNVDHLLTEIDKANIDLINMVKEKMRGKETQFTKKKLVAYYPAA